jgi:hypothetical protein
VVSSVLLNSFDYFIIGSTRSLIWSSFLRSNFAVVEIPKVQSRRDKVMIWSPESILFVHNSAEDTLQQLWTDDLVWIDIELLKQSTTQPDLSLAGSGVVELAPTRAEGRANQSQATNGEATSTGIPHGSDGRGRRRDEEGEGIVSLERLGLGVLSDSLTDHLSLLPRSIIPTNEVVTSVSMMSKSETRLQQSSVPDEENPPANTEHKDTHRLEPKSGLPEPHRCENLSHIASCNSTPPAPGGMFVTAIIPHGRPGGVRYAFKTCPNKTTPVLPESLQRDISVRATTSKLTPPAPGKELVTTVVPSGKKRDSIEMRKDVKIQPRLERAQILAKFEPLVSCISRLGGDRPDSLAPYKVVKHILVGRKREIEALGWSDFEQLLGAAVQARVVAQPKKKKKKKPTYLQLIPQSPMSLSPSLSVPAEHPVERRQVAPDMATVMGLAPEAGNTAGKLAKAADYPLEHRPVVLTMLRLMAKAPGAGVPMSELAEALGRDFPRREGDYYLISRAEEDGVLSTGEYSNSWAYLNTPRNHNAPITASSTPPSPLPPTRIPGPDLPLRPTSTIVRPHLNPNSWNNLAE